ncbi:hypothetical protein FACS1894166_13570 [Bacilli bacterium]|nr:hypothetical protein FACS1894166_13570 [Bacilli bacterium]
MSVENDKLLIAPQNLFSVVLTAEKMAEYNTKEPASIITLEVPKKNIA